MSHVTIYDVRSGKKIMEETTTAEKLWLENKLLRAQILNMLGKLDCQANFVPQITIDLASTLALEVEPTPAGCWVRRRTTENMGS
jgi:hypothetical protein